MLLTLFRLLSALPLRVLHSIGLVLGWIVYFLSPTYRRRLNENITRAGHGSARRAAVGESGKSIFELAFVWCAPQDKVLARATVENWEVAQAALDSKRGVIFLTPHLGCFEVIAQAIAQRVPLAALYRPPRKAALKPLYEQARARGDLSLAPANLAGVRTLLKTLKKGLPVGLLPDQVPQQGEGVWADFFGRPAYTMTLPAKLQQMTGAVVMLSYAERLPRGRGFTIRFVPFEPLESLPGQDAPTPQQQARAINAAMEALIARCPAQYVWSYNRYKTPRDVAGPQQNKDGGTGSGTTDAEKSGSAGRDGQKPSGDPTVEQAS